VCVCVCERELARCVTCSRPPCCPGAPARVAVQEEGRQRRRFPSFLFPLYSWSSYLVNIVRSGSNPAGLPGDSAEVIFHWLTGQPCHHSENST
ncbi:hypothetical protein ANANG_G00232190, partial [Anguilla anguilla]